MDYAVKSRPGAVSLHNARPALFLLQVSRRAIGLCSGASLIIRDFFALPDQSLHSSGASSVLSVSTSSFCATVSRITDMTSCSK